MISNIYLDTNQLDTSKRFCQSIKGTAFPDVRYTSSGRGGFHGQTISPGFYGGMSVMLDFFIIGDSFSDLATERENFVKILNDVIKNSGATLKLTKANGATVQLDVNSIKVTGDISAADVATSKMLVEMASEYPFFVSQTLHSSTAYILQGGGAAIPFAIPLDMTTGALDALVVANAGNVAAYPVYTFHGPLNYPTLTNLTTGDQLSVAVNLATASDILVVDTYNRTVLYGSTEVNGRHYVSGDFPTLAPGNNTIQLGAGVYNALGKCVIEWRDHYLGV